MPGDNVPSALSTGAGESELQAVRTVRVIGKSKKDFFMEVFLIAYLLAYVVVEFPASNYRLR